MTTGVVAPPLLSAFCGVFMALLFWVILAVAKPPMPPLAVDWGSMIRRPVKTLLEEAEFATSAECQIHDVWDRQFVSAKYQRCQPAESDIFIVTLRLSSSMVPQIMKANATNGRYYEPRVPSGRKPDPE